VTDAGEVKRATQGNEQKKDRIVRQTHRELYLLLLVNGQNIIYNQANDIMIGKGYTDSNGLDTTGTSTLISFFYELPR
jgi:hypothetical protein